MRTILLVLHIMGVSAWLGANIVQVMSTRSLVAAGGSSAGVWMRTTVSWGTKLYMPALIVILATGIALVIDGPYEFSAVFVSLGFLAIAVRVGLGIGIMKRRGEQAAVAFEAGDDAGGLAGVNKLVPFSVFDTAVVVVTIFAMTGRWGAGV